MLTGILLTLAAAACFECSYVLQTLEVRAAPTMARASVGALRGLALRPVWLMSIVLAVAGFGLQVLALRHIPLTLVQPLLATGLLGLLVFSATVLGERVGWREVGAVAAIGVGVAVIALTDPQRGPDDAPGLAFVLVAAVLGGAALSAFALRKPTAGLLLGAAIAADTLGSLSAAEAARSIPALLETIGWVVLAGAAGVAAVAAESAVLQRRGASRVAPIVLAGQVAMPVVLAPLVIGDRWGSGGVLVCGLALVIAGSALLAASGGVSRFATAGTGQVEDEVGGGREVGDLRP
jgi:drug/metabolite transporter (DMT)-like permease